ncbi:MAG: protein tyrosine phosphatase family protein [Pseudotabrizicola sp.]|uniref:protein tyrosine phosphatase family protein n=1 Tax=Pseudotabrizicola sp. TaxID=2939647 RepID=UPI002728A8FE|nr:protein tyrosine phosphatase family protein [Pseudotabrizicola sp.]MDO8883016.1 protein tyrosine phosphatase family protein [Pseudotabrizicola sp.]MDP2081541.1 protein tyrosine phosphatase family protein [Pseudotabrizicola sp.]MDZ7575744.1 protein tyrosine phosphatase family protein [Pseudotabrizicola sp.]
MDIRPLTPNYAVAPQIDPEDFVAIKVAGYTRVINNRPDAEIPASHRAAVMQAAAEAAGLEFVINPVIGGALTMANVTAQAEAIGTASGPVLAYCASGNRSSICWALANAGEMPADDLIGIPARHGYNLEALRPQIEILAKR